MRKSILIASVILFLFPVFVSAKSSHHKGYEHAKGKEISVSETSGWPIKIKSSTYLDAAIQSFSGMAVINAKPYNPWWRFFMKTPESTTINISGFPANTDLHVYTDGYRNHAVQKTDHNGNLTFSFPSSDGYEAIIKEKPSTYQVYIGGTLFSPIKGGDCFKIGIWTESTKTCALSVNVTQTIAIEDNDITLDGAQHSVSSAGGDGIYTKYSNVVIKNVTVQNSIRGVVYHDAITTVADGGRVENVIMKSNQTDFADEGVSNVKVTNSTIDGGNLGVYLFDQFDGFPTNNISITHVNFTGNTTDIFNDGTTFSLSTTTDRGNFWEKNTACVQDTANPSQCTNSYSTGGKTDSAPWACKNGWSVTCPVKTKPTPTPTRTGSPQPSGSASPVSFFTQNDGRWGGELYDNTDTIKGTCASTTDFNLSIKQCGCYITSVVNLLTHVGYTQFGDGTSLTPSTFNTWLKGNKGYSDTSDFNGNSVLTLTESLDKDFKLKFDEAYNTSTVGTEKVKELLDASLDDGIPVIAKVTGGHFILITGKSGDTYTVEDPTWYNTKTLNDENPDKKLPYVKDYDNEIVGVRIYEKESKTVSARFLKFFLGSPVSITIEDPLKRKLYYLEDSPTSYSQIPDSSYWSDFIIDPGLMSVPPNPKTSKFAWINNPIDGTYTITITGTGTGGYVFQVSGQSGNELAAKNTTTVGQQDRYQLTVQNAIPVALKKINMDKVDVCHIPPGNPSNEHTISIGASALKAHIGHGDYEGECKEDLKDSEQKENKEDKKKNKESKKK